MKQYIELEQSDYDALIQRMTEAEARCSAVEKQADAAAKASTAVQTSVTSLEAKVRTLEGWRGSADATMLASENKLKKVEPELVVLDARLDKAEPAILSLATRLDKHDQRETAGEATDKVLDERADVLEAWKVDINKTIAAYAARLATLEKPAPASDAK